MHNFRAVPVTHVTGYDSVALDVALQLPVAAQKKQFLRFIKSGKENQAGAGRLTKERAEQRAINGRGIANLSDE